MKKLSTVIFLIFTFSILNAESLPHTYFEVPYYQQGGEAPWADDKLGNKSELTIRTHGCALTAISMVLSYQLWEIEPGVMNRWLAANGGFVDAWNGNDYLGEVSLFWPALYKFNDSIRYHREDWHSSEADLDIIKDFLDQGIPVIAEVLYRGAPHYVVLCGYNGDNFIMNDPEQPEWKWFDSHYNINDQYGSGARRNIYGIRVFYTETGE